MKWTAVQETEQLPVLPFPESISEWPWLLLALLDFIPHPGQTMVTAFAKIPTIISLGQDFSPQETSLASNRFTWCQGCQGYL